MNQLKKKKNLFSRNKVLLSECYNFFNQFLICWIKYFISYLDMSKTPSSVLNSKIRGKKIVLPDNDENIISAALSLIWIKSNKKIESCMFEQDKVKISYKKNEGCVYFDLQEQESSSNFTFINKVWTTLPFSPFLDNFVHFLFRFWTFPVFGQFCPLFLSFLDFPRFWTILSILYQ